MVMLSFIVFKHDDIFRISVLVLIVLIFLIVVIDSVCLVIDVEVVVVVASITGTVFLLDDDGAVLTRVVLFGVAELLVDVRLLDPRPIRRKWLCLLRRPGSPEVHHGRLHLLRARLNKQPLLILRIHTAVVNVHKVAILATILVVDFFVRGALLL